MKFTPPVFWVGIRNISDYSPFGVLLKERTVESGFFRRSFNGMEVDPEVKGEGNSYDFGARMLDPRLGRWFTTDKHQNNYPAWSTYAGFGDNPILNVDIDGNDFIFFAGAGYKGELKEKKKFNKSFTSTMSEILGDNFSVVPGINCGGATDVMWGLEHGWTPIKNINENEILFLAVAHTNEVIQNLECGEPLNMVGSSYGSATAAQTALYILEHKDEYLQSDTKISLTLSSKMLDEKSPLLDQLTKHAKNNPNFRLIFQDFPEDNINGLAKGSVLEKDLLPLVLPHKQSALKWQTSMLNPWGNHTHTKMGQSTAKTYDLVKLMLITLELEDLNSKQKAETVLNRKSNATEKSPDHLDVDLESPSNKHGVPSF